MSNKERKKQLQEEASGRVIKAHEEGLWVNEFDKVGIREGIRSRLKFSGSLTVAEVSRNSLVSSGTVLRHFRALVSEGLAETITPFKFRTTE